MHCSKPSCSLQKLLLYALVLATISSFFLLFQQHPQNATEMLNDRPSSGASILVPQLVPTYKPTTINAELSVAQPVVSGTTPGHSVEKKTHISMEGCVMRPVGNVLIDTYSHLTAPPNGSVHIVCCQTSKGPWSIAVHPTWAPHGAARFMNMTKSNFFSTQVPLFRALKGFLIQFGLAGVPSIQQEYRSRGWLKDDASWLPPGPAYREQQGVKRYQAGYLGYAGAGKNSRGTQLIVALQGSGPLGGGSPWEVPFAQTIGDASFQTLKQVYTGYGNKPSQKKIQTIGISYVEKEYPLMDYIYGCEVVAEDVSWVAGPSVLPPYDPNEPVV